MNEFVSASENLAKQLLPIIGVACLICLLILLIYLIKVTKRLISTMSKADSTIDLVDKSIEKVQAPLDTAVKISKTVETVHDGTVEAIKDAKDFVVNNYDKIKEKILNKDEVQNIEEDIK